MDTRYIVRLALALAASSLGCVAVSSADAVSKAAPLPSFERVMLPAAPKAISDFELTDHNGRPFRFGSLKGQPALVFFGFAHCPDVCPTTLQQLKLFRQSRRELAAVPVVMISVDGERDAPAAMKAYLANFSADFVGLTGEPRKVRDIAAQFSAAFFKGQPRDASGDYVVEHSSQVYAVDRSGKVRAEFYDASIEAMQGVTEALLKE